VGTRPASSHLIDTGEGLILLDSGYPQSLYLVIDGIWRLGFCPDDIRMIIHSHGHYDHLGGTRALVELTGAKTYLGAEDVGLADGSVNLTWADLLGSEYREPFVPDVLFRDKDVLRLGNTEIRCVHTPGHTEGTYSFFFDAIGPEGPKRCGMFGGAGFNSMELAFLDERGLSHDCRSDYIRSIRRLKEERVDIFLGNHVGNNDTLGKARRMAETGENPFLNTNEEWLAFLNRLEGDMIRKIMAETPDEMPKDLL
jgi:metallo-beta-lactamase class B